MDKKPLIIANWKMNPAQEKEVDHLFGAVFHGVAEINGAEVVICPPFVYLNKFKSFLKSHLDKIGLGAQNCFYQDKGAYTGEISPLMLKNVNCQYVIIGHSERRKYFGESDEMVNKKIKAALKAGLDPILCVGEETRDTFDSRGKPTNEMSLFVGEQLEKNLSGISSARVREISIAYEPVWAIGTDNPCSPNEAMKAALFIRKILTKLYNRQAAEKARILYGGSVTGKNAADYIKEANMDGLLVGGASLNASEFVGIIKSVVG